MVTRRTPLRAVTGCHSSPSGRGVIKPGSESSQTISLVDIMATCADATDYKLPETAAEDSVSLLEVFKDVSIEKPLHEAVICHSSTGQFVVRKGKWKILFCPGSGGWSAPKDAQAKKQGLPDWQLYDLLSDPKETTNLVNSRPEVAEELKGILKKYVEQGRSTPGAAQPNHGKQNWWPQLPWKKGE